MAKVSVIIPSRQERFLIPTIEDIFRNRRGECEVVAVLDQPDWPAGWKELCAKYPDLHTVHNGTSIGMRGSINKGVASAISRGAKYIMKLDAHCLLDEGFDVKLLSDIEPNWIVIPRRKRLDPDNWTVLDVGKPDVDYHYLSFPDDPNDFGGPGLNGKVWTERILQRKDKPEYEIDDEMSSQGSAWLCSADYFQELELMDTDSFGPFWCEAQEVLMKAWLSGGRCVVNKKTFYAHLHKGSTHGRGYKLPESWLKQGRNAALSWIYNDAWAKQTLPFKWLIERFWPVPSWPDDWEKKLYEETGRKARVVVNMGDSIVQEDFPQSFDSRLYDNTKTGLQIHRAFYGIDNEQKLDVLEKVRALVNDDSLDIVVNNATLDVGNPFRGHRKTLSIQYSFDGSEKQLIQKQEKDWLIIGTPQAHELQEFKQRDAALVQDVLSRLKTDPVAFIEPLTATALNDLLIRRFSISPQRLRAPMPIELPSFHRNDLAKLFAELGFTRGAEIGVAEGHFSEILCQSIPDLQLLCVDPWHSYSDNPQHHSKEHQEFSLNETKRRLAPYGDNVKLDQRYSMDAVRDVAEGSLDFAYVDANHKFNYCVMDIIEWSKKVRSGGIVAGDDYYAMNEKHWHDGGVVDAVQAYTRANRIGVWYIFAGHKSVDWMWVKP